MVCTVGLLFIASNLYAASGDLIVNGNVGIGTTSPVEKLDVAYGHIKITEGYLKLKTTGGSREWWIADAVNVNDGKFAIYDNTATPPTHRLVIDTNGNVGIGTTTPNAKLQVKGSIGIGSHLPQANKVLCWTSTGLIGFCASAMDASGACSCYQIE